MSYNVEIVKEWKVKGGGSDMGIRYRAKGNPLHESHLQDKSLREQ